MQVNEYEKYLAEGYSVECNECSKEILHGDDWAWVSGNLYCSECKDVEYEELKGFK